MATTANDAPVTATYEASKRVYLKQQERASAAKHLARQYGMNSNSANDTIYNFLHMMNGEEYKRTLNTKTTDYFLTNIYRDFGLLALANAVSALEQHICYYEGVRNATMKSLRRLVTKHTEVLKAATIPEDDLPSDKEMSDYDREYEEGLPLQITTNTRKRCATLIAKAKAHFRDADGELYCFACNWRRPRRSLTRDIIEIHHAEQLSTLPPDGVRLTLDKALKHLTPLCPNCHRIAHAKPDNGIFTLSELKRIVKR